MSNSYFQFKQFRIDQGETAMKVTTEGCLFGAWVTRLAKSPGRILDIGTGTGLLALMLAQQYEKALIDAVEMDEAAANQAVANFSGSLWRNRLKLHQSEIQTYQSEQKYDLIISNPPFYKNSLQSGVANVNLARHDDSLPQSELLQAIDRLLAETGRAFVLFPPKEAMAFKALAAKQGLFAHSVLTVFNSQGAVPFRMIIEYGRIQQEVGQSVLVIKGPTGNYTGDFIELLKGYYLGF
ncbi:MAG: methyltransferase [Marinoscillum sp.]